MKAAGSPSQRLAWLWSLSVHGWVIQGPNPMWSCAMLEWGLCWWRGGEVTSGLGPYVEFPDSDEVVRVFGGASCPVLPGAWWTSPSSATRELPDSQGVGWATTECLLCAGHSPSSSNQSRLSPRGRMSLFSYPMDEKMEVHRWEKATPTSLRWQVKGFKLQFLILCFSYSHLDQIQNWRITMTQTRKETHADGREKTRKK